MGREERQRRGRGTRNAPPICAYPDAAIRVNNGPMFRRKFTAAPDPDQPLYVIGDIHGRADLLGTLLDLIRDDISAHDLTNARRVFVGDYFDRGPQSRETLNLLMALARSEPGTIFLRGNHDYMLLKFLDNPETARSWLRHGGDETLASFGLPGLSEDSPDETLQNAARDLMTALTPAGLLFLHDLRTSTRSGNIFVAHAGADPARPTDQQDEHTLLWGVPAFRSRTRRDGIWVAHGHFADPEPHAADGRISVDTGAYFSDRLTAARIRPGSVGFLTTNAA